MKLTNNLTLDSQLEKYRAHGFDKYRLSIIIAGLAKGLDVSHYAKISFNADKMRVIKSGLERGLDVSIYAFPQYPGVLMQLLYELMVFDDDFDISKFSADGTLKIEYLLLHHEDLSSRYRMLSRFSDVAREHVLRRAPYYTSYK